MSRFDPISLETALLPPGTLSLADCLALIERDPGLSDVRRRDLASGLRRLATAVDKPPALLKANLGWLQPRLSRVEPAALGLSASRPLGQDLGQHPEQRSRRAGPLRHR
jgi:hypothetical protein